jgi:predicted ATPase
VSRLDGLPPGEKRVL